MPTSPRLYDGGALPDGAPYMVMEFVNGATILMHANQEQLSPKARLQLFRDVVGAVAHAHQNLIVHRDLTPNNVLVTRDGVVKLIDFGISRPETEAVAATPEVQLSHTPGYAAPERSTASVATTLVDIYSLGALLDDLCPKPRSRDVDAIVAKASAADPRERYASASALLDDVNRTLSGRAVAARRGETFYPVLAFARRHPLSVGGAFAAVLALSAALTVTATLYQRAEEARAIEQARFNDVRGISTFMMNELYDRIGELPRSTPARARLAEEAQFYLDRLAASRRRDAAPDLELTLSLVEGYRRLAEVRGSPSIPNLGDREGAKAAFAAAHAIAATLDQGELDKRIADGAAPSPRETRIAYVLGRLEGSEAVLDFFDDYQADRAHERLDRARLQLQAASRGGGLVEQVGATFALADKVEILSKTDPTHESLPGLVDLLERELGDIDLDQPDLGRTEREHARGLVALLPKARANFIYAAGDKPGSRVEISKAIDQFGALVAANPENRLYLKNLSLILVWRAGLLLEMDDAPNATADYDKAVEVLEKFIVLDPADDEVEEMETYVRGSRAFFRALILKDPSALRETVANAEAKRQRAEADPASRMKRLNYILALRPLGDAFWNQDRIDDACRSYRLAKSEYDTLAVAAPLSHRDEQNDYSLVVDALTYCKA